MSAGKRMKRKKLSEEALSKVFDFSPVAKKKALNYGSEDYPEEGKLNVRLALALANDFLVFFAPFFQIATEEKTPIKDIAPLKKRPVHNLKDEDSAVVVG